MSLSINEIARLHKDFIIKQLSDYEAQLLPSSEEDQELVRRAVFSVRNKSVIFDRYIPFSTNLYTTVHDVKSPSVTIEFSDEKVTCSCPAQGICRHELAVFLSLYQYSNSVQEWASNWRSKKNVQLESIAQDRSPENWRKLIDEVAMPQISPNKRIEGYAIMTVVDVVKTRLNRYTPFEREWIPMYKLFVEIGIFQHITKHFSTFAYHDSNQTYYLQYYADKTMERVTTLVNELESQSRLFAIDPFYDELQKMVFELLETKTLFPAQQVNLYFLFWEKLFTSEARAQIELERLLQAENKLKEQGVKPRPIMAIFYMMLKQHDALDKQLQDLTLEEVELYLSTIQFANTKQATEVSTIILRAILPMIQSFLHEVVTPMQRQQTAYKIVQLFEKTTLTEQEEMMLYASLGKFGIQPFSNYLIQAKRYEDWAALHHTYPSSISYLETCGLKTVLEEAPHVTLSIYHHFALEELAQKSRMNYKQAVKLWKNMRNAAKKAGRTSFFEEYMAVIRTDNKRLRALQEELDKGNF